MRLKCGCAAVDEPRPGGCPLHGRKAAQARPAAVWVSGWPPGDGVVARFVKRAQAAGWSGEWYGYADAKGAEYVAVRVARDGRAPLARIFRRVDGGGWRHVLSRAGHAGGVVSAVQMDAMLV